MVELQTNVINLENQLQVAWSEVTHTEWENARKQLQQVENWETERLSSQARLTWMRDGDKNSKFYHAVIKERRRRNITQISRPDDTVTVDPKEIGTLAEQHYKSLFQVSEYFIDEELFSDIHPTLDQAANGSFCAIPTIEEVWQTIQQLNPDSAPGNDGFTGHFYRTC